MQTDQIAIKKHPLEIVPLCSLSDDELVELSKERLLSLSLEEMRAVQNHFHLQEREPTDVELETIAQTWSEHCKHKTFKGIITYKENEDEKIFDDLLKSTIVKATHELNKPFCLSVFEDNAGVISFDEKDGVAFKAETHNHPSALEPYGGAGTGIGGVIRDILGVGLGAKPVLNTDVFCVGEFGSKHGLQKESGILPPERILAGVISGVRDYGNRMGIPTSNGAVIFHPGYYANPLVFCGTVGLIPKDKIKKRVSSGEQIVSIGGRTGRDGIHGATFSSLALEKEISASVVQIGNAIVEKKAMDVILRARDSNLYTAITDCGAGGYSSAVGELASDCGAKVFLEKVPLKYPGLAPWEIWVSESQERMVLSIPPQHIKAFQELCRAEDVECSILGEFTNTKLLEVFYHDERVCNLDLHFLHKGIPRVKKSAYWNRPIEQKEKELKIPLSSFEIALKKLISHPNIASKRWIVRQYDHEVQGGSVIKPFVGEDQLGPSDAAVFRPRLDTWKGVGVACGVNPFYGEIDPYWMAACAIDEALRNLVAVGASIENCAILDNFCWGDIHNEEVLGGLVRCSQGCYDFAKIFGTPFISGKDSLNNTWRKENGEIVSIPGTLLISAVSIIDDVRKCIAMDLKKPGNLLFLVGETKDEFGGSHLNRILKRSGGKVPKVDGPRAKQLMRTLSQCIQQGRVRSCHDLSEGGLAVALAESCFAGNLGVQIEIGDTFTSPSLIFSESQTRWVIEVEPNDAHQVKKLLSGLPLTLIGQTTKKPHLTIHSAKKRLIHLKTEELKKLWLSFSNQQ